MRFGTLVLSFFVLAMPFSVIAAEKGLPLKCAIDYGGRVAIEVFQLDVGTVYKQNFIFPNQTVVKLGPEVDRKTDVHLQVQVHRNETGIFVQYLDLIPGEVVMPKLQYLLTYEATYSADFPQEQNTTIKVFGVNGSGFRCHVPYRSSN